MERAKKEEALEQKNKSGSETEEPNAPPVLDIRVRLKKMQGSEKRASPTADSLLHQSELNSAPLCECKADIESFMNRNVRSDLSPAGLCGRFFHVHDVKVHPS